LSLEQPSPTAERPPTGSPARSGHRALIDAVQALQRRHLWAQGLLWGLVAALALIVLAGFVGQRAPGLASALFKLSPLAVIAVALGFGLGLARRRVGTTERTARLIAERAPELGLDVLSAVQLERELAEAPDRTFSAQLAEAFFAKTSERAAALPPSRVVSDVPLKRAAAGTGGALLLGLLLLVVSRERLVTGWARAWNHGAASGQTGPAQREPITGDVELTYTYPAHTGLLPRTVSGTRGDIQAPAGTVVKLMTRSDRPVRRAGVVIGEALTPLEVQGERQLSGSFVVEAGGHYAFVFQDDAGREVARGPDLPITVEADAAPQVTLRAPEQELEVDPGQEVELRWDVRDDYGLTGLALVYREPGASEETRVKLPLEDGRTQSGRYRWSTKSLRLSPGDRVTYYVEALDNDAIAGAKRGVSRTQTLKLYDASEKRQQALERVEALWGDLLELLADRLESPDRDRKSTAEQLLASSRIDVRGAELMASMRDTAAELARQRDVPPELPAALNNVADSTGRRVRATTDFRRVLERLVGRDSKLTPDLKARLAELVREEITTEENDVLYLEALIDRRKLEELRSLGEQLLAERRALSARVEELRNAPDEAGREAVLREVDALRRRIEELMQRMSELAKGIRDEHLNAEAVQELMSEGDMGSMLDEVEKLMREGKIDEALSKLQELGMQMEEMLQDFERASDTQGAEQFPELTERFQKFQADLQQTVAEQERVAKATQSLKDKASRQDQARVRQRGEQLREKLTQKLEQISRDYQELPGDRLDRQALPSLERAQESLRAAKQALEGKDYDLAAEAAQAAAENAQELAQWGQLQQERDALFFNPPAAQAQTAELAEQLDKDARLAREVSDALSSLFPRPGSQLSQAERQQLQQLSKDQRDLEQRAQGLSEQLEQMQQLAPVFDQEAMNQLEQVAGRMGQAGERLEGQDARRGHGEQRAALDGLGRFQEQMQQRGQGKGGKGIPLPLMAGGMPGGRREGSGRGLSNEQVEIPDEDDFQSPREFRKDLLDAMKQGAPERYREQLKRYYEELVK